MLRWTGLKLEKKITLFERTASRKRKGIFPDVMVGNSSVYVGIDGEFVSLTRDSLSLLWHTSLDGMRPLSEWNDRLIFAVGLNHVGMFDVTIKRLKWTVETRSGCMRWRDVLVLGKEPGFTIIEPTTGRQSNRISTSGPGASNFVICGDVAVFDESDGGDPVRAVSLIDGSLVWERDLFEELRSEHGVDYRSPILAMTPGSLSDRFIGTRGAATFSFSLEDGRVLWKADVTVPYYIPLVVQARIPILQMNRFVVIDEATGSIIADQKYDELANMFHARRGSSYSDTVSFVSESGHIAVFDINDGRLLWSKQYPVKFYDSAMADGRLLVTGSDGKLWVFTSDWI